MRPEAFRDCAPVCIGEKSLPCWGVQEMMADALAELEVHNISTAPKFGISYSSLKDAATSQAACQRLFEEMKDAVGQPSSTSFSPPTGAVHPVHYSSCGACCRTCELQSRMAGTARRRALGSAFCVREVVPAFDLGSGPNLCQVCVRLSLTFSSFTGGTEAIVIKPAEDSDAAQAQLAEWTDLALYARGIVERQIAIPPDLLSLPHGLTLLPLEPPLRFVAEPYVATDKYVAPVSQVACWKLSWHLPSLDTARDQHAGDYVQISVLLILLIVASHPLSLAVGVLCHLARQWVFIQPGSNALCWQELEVTTRQWHRRKWRNPQGVLVILEQAEELHHAG